MPPPADLIWSPPTASATYRARVLERRGVSLPPPAEDRLRQIARFMRGLLLPSYTENGLNKKQVDEFLFCRESDWFTTDRAVDEWVRFRVPVASSELAQLYDHLHWLWGVDIPMCLKSKQPAGEYPLFFDIDIKVDWRSLRRVVSRERELELERLLAGEEKDSPPRPESSSQEQPTRKERAAEMLRSISAELFGGKLERDFFGLVARALLLVGDHRDEEDWKSDRWRWDALRPSREWGNFLASRAEEVFGEDEDRAAGGATSLLQLVYMAHGRVAGPRALASVPPEREEAVFCNGDAYWRISYHIVFPQVLVDRAIVCCPAVGYYPFSEGTSTTPEGDLAAVAHQYPEPSLHEILHHFVKTYLRENRSVAGAIEEKLRGFCADMVVPPTTGEEVLRPSSEEQPLGERTSESPGDAASGLTRDATPASASSPAARRRRSSTDDSSEDEDSSELPELRGRANVGRIRGRSPPAAAERNGQIDSAEAPGDHEDDWHFNSYSEIVDDNPIWHESFPSPTGMRLCFTCTIKRKEEVTEEEAVDSSGKAAQPLEDHTSTANGGCANNTGFGKSPGGKGKGKFLGKGKPHKTPLFLRGPPLRSKIPQTAFRYEVDLHELTMVQKQLHAPPLLQHDALDEDHASPLLPPETPLAAWAACANLSDVDVPNDATNSIPVGGSSVANLKPWRVREFLPDWLLHDHSRDPLVNGGYEDGCWCRYCGLGREAVQERIEDYADARDFWDDDLAVEEGMVDSKGSGKKGKLVL